MSNVVVGTMSIDGTGRIRATPDDDSNMTLTLYNLLIKTPVMNKDEPLDSRRRLVGLATAFATWFVGANGRRLDINAGDLDIDGVLSGTFEDESSVTRAGPTVLSGDDAYIGERATLDISTGGDQTIDAAKYEMIRLVGVNTLTADVTWILNNPPNGERVNVSLQATAAARNGYTVHIHDEAGNPIPFLGGNAEFAGGFGLSFEWLDLRFSPGASTWIVRRVGGA